MMQDSASNSALFSGAVEALMRLPGVGQKSAQRYALHLLSLDEELRERFIESLRGFLTEMQYCPSCNGFSDDGCLCPFCRDPRRDENLLCVVADVRDVLAIERSGQFRGHYFVLGGVIDPMRGVGPRQLPIPQLIGRIQASPVREVILAFSADMEGDTTTFYLRRLLEQEQEQITISVPARGVPFGESIDQTDELTLGRALQQRATLYAPTNSLATTSEATAPTPKTNAL